MCLSLPRGQSLSPARGSFRSTVIERSVQNVQQVFGDHMNAFEIAPAVLKGLQTIKQES
jgi:hypothetical protein